MEVLGRTVIRRLTTGKTYSLSLVPYVSTFLMYSTTVNSETNDVAQTLVGESNWEDGNYYLQAEVKGSSTAEIKDIKWYFGDIKTGVLIAKNNPYGICFSEDEEFNSSNPTKAKLNCVNSNYLFENLNLKTPFIITCLVTIEFADGSTDKLSDYVGFNVFPVGGTTGYIATIIPQALDVQTYQNANPSYDRVLSTGSTILNLMSNNRIILKPTLMKGDQVVDYNNGSGYLIIWSITGGHTGYDDDRLLAWTTNEQYDNFESVVETRFSSSWNSNVKPLNKFKFTNAKNLPEGQKEPSIMIHRNDILGAGGSVVIAQFFVNGKLVERKQITIYDVDDNISMSIPDKVAVNEDGTCEIYPYLYNRATNQKVESDMIEKWAIDAALENDSYSNDLMHLSPRTTYIVDCDLEMKASRKYYNIYGSEYDSNVDEFYYQVSPVEDRSYATVLDNQLPIKNINTTWSYKLGTNLIEPTVIDELEVSSNKPRIIFNDSALDWPFVKEYRVLVNEDDTKYYIKSNQGKYKGVLIFVNDPNLPTDYCYEGENIGSKSSYQKVDLKTVRKIAENITPAETPVIKTCTEILEKSEIKPYSFVFDCIMAVTAVYNGIEDNDGSIHKEELEESNA